MRRGTEQRRTERRRGLDEVLHHFIPEDEQRAARPREATAPAPVPPRWLLAASPERPLSRALALDLASALARTGIETAVVAPPPAPAGLPGGVRWCAVRAGDPDALRAALAALPDGTHALALVHPAELGRVVAALGPARPRAALLPVDASGRGSARALGWLRASAEQLAGLELCAVVVGATSRARARDCFARLASAARRQLDLRLASFGEVERDEASFRSLLRDVPVVALDVDAASARSLEHLSRQLAAPREAEARA